MGPSCFLGQRKTLEREKTKVVFFINAQNLTKEDNWEKVMNLQEGFALGPIQGVFNAEIRGITSKKTEKVF